MNKGSCELRNKLKSTQYEFLSDSEFYSNNLFNVDYLLNTNDLISINLQTDMIFMYCIDFVIPEEGFYVRNLAEFHLL